MVASLVHEHLVQLRALSEHDALQPNNIFQIEITLWMFYKVLYHPSVVLFHIADVCIFKMGEGLAEDLLQKTRDFFVSTIDHLVRGAGSVSNHPHPAISNIYFNVIFRYAKLLQNTPQTLQPVLASLLDHRYDSFFSCGCCIIFNCGISEGSARKDHTRGPSVATSSSALSAPHSFGTTSFL